MRQIGTIGDGELADRFADFLRGQGMACSLDREDNGWAVWVQDEDRIPAARQELESFLADPQHERYRQARQQADTKIREEHARRKAARRNTVSVREQWNRSLAERCPLTIGLLLICAVIAFFTRLGGTFLMPGERYQDIEPLMRQLWISPDASWRAITQSGEIWRLWTPMFLHYGWLHIIFNGLWLKDFGTLLEDRVGSLRFLVLVLLIGAISNVLQFELGNMPAVWKVPFTAWFHPQFWDLFPRNFRFGGMSGVNYGLFGYLWVRGKLDPNSGLGVSPQIVLWMGVWFLICWTGAVGHVANMAHAGGLATGVALGALASIPRRK
jgi:GlpG protein